MKDNKKRKWKRVGSWILAVCLIATIVMPEQIVGVYAEEEDVQAQESQTEESGAVDASVEETQENTEETSEVSDEDKNEEDTQEQGGKDVVGSSSSAVPENETDVAVQSDDNVIQNAVWTVENGVVSVSGNGTKPTSITVSTSKNRSSYKGDKSVVFGYKIESNDGIEGDVNITVTDCGIMSDDDSIEIWKVTDTGCSQLNSGISVSEGRVSFVANGLGEYIAVSNVTTVDLSKGGVTVTSDSLNGVQQDGTQIKLNFSEAPAKKYRVSQSNQAIRCQNEIVFNTEKNYTQDRTIILDGINTDKDIEIPAKEYKVMVTLLLRNINQVHRIYYGTSSQRLGDANKGSSLKIDDYNGSGGSSGELYIPYKMDDHQDELDYVLTKVNSGIGDDWSRAGIGGGRSQELQCCTGLTIAGGKIRVLVQNKNGATAIGGGGNGDAQLSITGGDITAICSSTGAAIGGGIGWVNRGGVADISISGGTIYAENIDQYTRDGTSYGGVAIGSGSSMEKEGSQASIAIGGNSNVTAYAHYGNGIGSGNSYQGQAAKASINISEKANVTTNALGGGTSKENKGGSAEITIKDNAKVNCKRYSEINDKWDSSTTNVLGAFGIGGGNSAGAEKGGSADVNVSGGTLNCNGGNIGGGDATGTGEGGDASIFVSGGTLDCASIGGGNSVSGIPGSVTSKDQKNGVVVTGGTLNTGTIGGGTNERGEIGFATAEISGGNIQGQFILANTNASKKCVFTMTGGTIDNQDLGKGNYQKAQNNGGAVYLSDPNGKVNISGGTIRNASAEFGGAVYMTTGSFELSGNATIQNCLATANNSKNDMVEARGGAVYLDNGTVTMTGGSILSCEAAQGAGIYIAGGTLEISGGMVKNNTATQNGGGVYLENGSLIISGGQIAYNKAVDGAGAYLQAGNLTVSGSGDFDNNIASNDGGGAYLAGGVLTINEGSFSNNKATDGGGAYAADGKVRMFGGFLTANYATHDGGGLYVSSDKEGADVVIRSGSLTKNIAGEESVQGNGGAIAVKSSNDTPDKVIIGLCENHNIADLSNRSYTAFNYTEEYDNGMQHTHSSCPNISDNKAYGDGGGIYMDSNASNLEIDCLLESGNTSVKDSSGNSVMATGGTVKVGDDKYNLLDTDTNKHSVAYGNIKIGSSMLVSGGTVDIYGDMDNPFFQGDILVNIAAGAGKFQDYRKSVSEEVRDYKIHYFENFTNGGVDQASGKYIAKQYSKGISIKAESVDFQHEGWKVIGWANEQNASVPNYDIGTEICDGKDYLLWPKEEDAARILYAVWRRTTYTVHYDANSPVNQYEGKMDDQIITYNDKNKLSANNYNVVGYRFNGWNTKADGTGDAYINEYEDSNITLKDGAKVTLYAQWVKCNHKAESGNQVNITYTADSIHHSITESCDCGGHTVTATLLAADAYHDDKEHPARITYTGTGQSMLNGVLEIKYYKKGEDTTYTSQDSIPKDTGNYKAEITVGGESVSVEYAIKDPTEGFTIDAASAAGQKFETISNSSSEVEVVSDDAFTLQYDVNVVGDKSDTNRYQKVPTITFSQVLPEGTTVIMQTGEQFYYYKVKAEQKQEFALTDFIRMGTESEKFNYTFSNQQNYRFIVDFSHLVNENSIQGELNGELKYSDSSNSDNKTKTAGVKIKQKSPFDLDINKDNSTITVSAPSGSLETRWENSSLLLAIKQRETNSESLPSDTILTIKIGNQTSIYQMNKNREFLIPLNWRNSQEIAISLKSATKSLEDRKYTLSADLYVTANTDEKGKGTKKSEVKATLDSIQAKIEKSIRPSIKLTGSDRLIKQKGILTLSIEKKNIENVSYSVIITDLSETTTYYMGTLSDDNQSFAINLPESMKTGSYCLKVTAGNGILAVPYYFNVK